MGIDGIHKRAIQVKDQCSHIILQTYFRDFFRLLGDVGRNSARNQANEENAN